MFTTFQADTGGKEGENTYSTPNRNWKVLQTYKTGQVIEIETVMTAHHWVSEHTPTNFG